MPYVINQNRYSILDRTVETNGALAASNELNKGMITFSPLAKGQLTDRYLNGIPADSRIRTDGRFLHESDLPEAKVEKLRELNELAKKKAVSFPRSRCAGCSTRKALRPF
nr:aldo/keto reductase [Allobaculum sp. Allo2]